MMGGGRPRINVAFKLEHSPRGTGEQREVL